MEDTKNFNYDCDFNVNLRRPIYTEIELNDAHPSKKIESNNIIASGIHHVKKHYKPSADCTKNFLLDRFPIFKWILNYDFKQNTVQDLVGGFTIGIVHIPQSRWTFFLYFSMFNYVIMKGMAYTMLALLPPYVGLYVSIFPVIIYILFGTSNHLSMGKS